LGGGEEQSPSGVADMLQRARNAYAADDLTACGEYVERARALDPQALEINRWQARLAWRASDWKTLGEAAQSYLEIHPSDREMAQFAARAFSNSKQWLAAAQAWRRVAELRHGWPEAWLQLARAQLKADMPHAAARSARRLRDIAGSDALLASARLAVERGQIAEAARHFARLAAEAPERVRDELQAYEKKGDARAVALAALALGNSPGGDEYGRMSKTVARDLLSRAVASERRGRAVDAYLDYAVMAQIEPGDVLAKTGQRRTLQFLQDAAREQVGEGDRKRAFKTYLQILYCQPDDGRALAALGQLSMADQDWRKAAELWASFLEVSPGDPKALVQHARALDRAQEFSAALAAWHAVLSVETDNIEAQLALAKLPSRIVKAGRHAVEEQRYAEAADILLAVPGDASEHDDAMRRLDQVARHLRKEMRAAYKERRFEWVVRCGIAAGKAAPGNEDVQRLLAQSAMRTRDYAIAADAWRRLMELAPAARSSATLQLARCQLRLGQIEDGRTLLTALLRDEPGNAEAAALAAEFEARVHV
jgi:tetratricopeptide (TPR) repeat protein